MRTQLPSVFIRGRLVRCVHLPESLDPAEAVEAHRRKLTDVALREAREHARGARNPPGGRGAAQHAGDAAPRTAAAARAKDATS